MELRLSQSHQSMRSEQDLKLLKELFLKEILFQSLLKDWFKREKIPFKKNSLKALNPEGFVLFFTNPSKLKALKKYQSFTLFKSALIKHLKNSIPEPDLKTQKQFYQKNQALFKDPAKCQLEQILVDNEKLALSLYDRIKQGESFSLLSKNHSLQKDPGWIQKGQWDIFDQACFKTQNSFSSPLKSDYGYHLFLKKELKASHQKSFKKSQEKIIDLLKEKELSTAFQNWLKEESLKKSFWIDKKSLEQIKIQYKRKGK